MKKNTKSAIVFAVTLCMTLFVATASYAANLTDIAGHWAESYIEYGVEAGYISGYEDGTFLPDKTVSRAEFSKMINNAVKLTSTGDAKAEFADVASKDWFFNEVKKAENAGYISGYEDSTFRPNNTVSRQEAAVMLSRIVLPVTERANADSFNDSNLIDSWAKDSVSMIAAKGYIKGDENKNFNPKGALTRSQAAKLICEFVKNENIVNRNQNAVATEDEVVYSETLFTDDVIIEVEDAIALKVVFKNCRVLGNVYVKTEGAVVELENAKIKNLYVEAEDAFIDVDNNSEVKNTYVEEPATLKGDGFKKVVLSGEDLSQSLVDLEGNFDKVEVAGDALITITKVKELTVSKKVSLVIHSGKVENLYVEEAAKDSTINLSKNAVVDNAHNKEAVSYVGSGTIEVANNNVTGVSFNGVTVNKIVGKKGDGDSVGSKTDSDFFKDVTVTPENKKSSVAISSSVSLTFLSEVYDKNGDKLTSAYVEDNFKFTRSSTSGTSTAFTATVASSNKKITIKPEDNYKNSTKYYLVIPAGVLTYEDGTENDEFVTYFTTIAAPNDKDDDSSSNEDDENASVTMSPKSGSEDVSVNSSIKLTFSGTLKAYSGTLDEDYIEEEAIEIREGSKTGDTVSFSASVSGKTITLVPSRLLGSTDYYVIILGNKLKVGGDTLSKTTLSFTTEEGTAISISPASGATNVSTTPEITVSFAEPMLNYKGDELDEDYIIDEVILFRKSSATKTDDEYQVSFSVKEIAENGRKFVIVPDVELESGVTYYIIVVEESLVGETTETENAKVTSSFKTASAMAPMFTPYDEQENVAVGTEIKISFSDVLMTNDSKKDDRREADDEYLEELIDDGYITLKRGSKNIKFTATIDGDGKAVIITPDDALDAEKTYTVSIKAKSFYSQASTSKSNAAGSATFNTNVAMSPTITPKDEAEDVSLTVNPTIKFNEKILNDEGKELKSLYLKRSITFVDQYGEEVDFTASIEGSVITVEPEEDLEGNVAYTLTLLAGTIQNQDGIFNEEVAVTFTTKISNTLEVTPASGNKTASPLVNPTVKFGTELYTLTGDPVDEEYASEYIFLTEGTKSTDVADAIPAAISMSEDGRTFTIVPEYELDFGTKYYINVVEKKFLYADEETKNKGNSTYFTVINEPEFKVEPVSAPNTKTSVKITFTSKVADSSDDELVQIVVEDENGEVLKTQAITSTSKSTVTVSGLETGEHTLYVYILIDGEFSSDVVEVSAETKA
ncbi:MAG: hypothetical protein E7600_01095 [Ruminococcaceae bacterium]|nr:hypothetical protein [Oscillospiraceae bacterium]